jgi:glyoxalase family protein
MKPLGGLHHVTAITGEAPGNVAFYTRTLGMRLVKKTVNQDDVSAYHLFYADAKGSPGTDLTFFDWPRTPSHQPGVPDIAPVSLRVAGDQAIQWWQARFQERGVAQESPAEVGGRLRLPFLDPEGQRLELVADGGVPGGQPWSGSPVPEEFQVKGLQGAALTSARPQSTADLLTGVLGFRASQERSLEGGGREYLYEVAGGGPGTELRLLVPQRASWSSQGRGGVHHLALRVGDEAAQDEWRGRLLAAGLQPTPVIDRFYFRSVYFREPGGNLFEIATDGPGFAADEPLGSLGGRLALPPFLEARRAEIEADLVPLEV